MHWFHITLLASIIKATNAIPKSYVFQSQHFYNLYVFAPIGHERKQVDDV